MKVFLNPHCNYGRGLRLWKGIEREIRERTGQFETEEILSPEEFHVQVSRALQGGENVFIAAGGDGTVNLLLNALMNSGEHRATIGAIGLGSSNDFHKPFRSEALVRGIPLRIDSQNASLCDVIRVNYQDIQHRWVTRFCFINASIGITAEANALFNSRVGILKMLQRFSVNAAISVAALLSILAYRNLACLLSIDGDEAQKFRITNLGIIKNPHFAGSLCYDTPIGPDDGKIGINLCADLTLLETIQMLIALSNSRFCGLPKTQSWTATRASVSSQHIFALEMDGEVFNTDCADFSVMPKAIRCCQ